MPRAKLVADVNDDGVCDGQDDLDKNYLPLIVAVNEDTQELTVKKVGLPASYGATLKLKKTGSGTGKVVVKDGNTIILDENISESSDIFSKAENDDLILTLEGASIGGCTLELVLSINNTTIASDQIMVKVVRSDVVFRRGNDGLATLIGETFTHGGIDWEIEIVDVGDFGIQQGSLSDFEAEASNSSLKARVRLKKESYMSRRIWAKVFDNMQSENYARPTGAKPWNLFTTYDNYETSNCNEFVHEQFRKAVSDVYSEIISLSQSSLFAFIYSDPYNGKLVPGKHKVTFDSRIPGASMAVVAARTLLYVRAKKEGAVLTEIENHFEGQIIPYFLAPGGRYAAGIQCSHPQCPKYPELPLRLFILATDWEEAHITTTTPECFLGSTFFETITY